MAIFKTVKSVFPLIFATLSLAFVIISFRSSDWAHQDFYPVVATVDSGFEVAWYNSTFAKYRSPFVVCGFDQTAPNVSTVQIDVQCQRFKIYGAGKTSCESYRSHNYTITSSDYIRDDRMCQQIHMSGNLLVAALVFVIIGFTISLPLTYYSLMVVFGRESSELQDDNDTVTTTSAVPKSSKHYKNGNSEPVSTLQSHHRRSRYHHKNKRVSYAITFLAYSMIVSLSIAAVATLLSQFYGILGLIQSNPTNGWFATNTGMPEVLPGDIDAGPWVQGKGLTVYTSLGWLFGALAAGAAGGVWGRWLHGRQY